MTIGNTYTQGEQSNVFITNYDEEGNINWQKEFNGVDSLNDYGISLITDSSDNIYIVGTT